MGDVEGRALARLRRLRAANAISTRSSCGAARTGRTSPTSSSTLRRSISRKKPLQGADHLGGAGTPRGEEHGANSVATTSGLARGAPAGSALS
ncbi:hypothetical protein ebA2129 [Aromatoleum aromaticum EbN1]|uniref:Uncharacterized protein n=1 Tax=Aromatoleum aromaticum (strain DSM 19018 / LMG 30748 / EbN1) TaxID=76114 RepID=Q5P5V8_AROAE|nr:hypothetical protein ebA2129 [Aromatoleum aromaticum EbN1]